MDCTVPIATSECATIWVERDATDCRCMPLKEVNLGTGECIIYPNTDATAHCQPRTIGRVRYIQYQTFTQTCDYAIG